MALMLCFSDYDATGFLDAAAGRLATSDLLDQCVDHVLDHAGDTPQPLPHPPFPSSTLTSCGQPALEHSTPNFLCMFPAPIMPGTLKPKP